MRSRIRPHGGPDFTHGTTRGYKTFGCKCSACQWAVARAHKAYRLRRMRGLTGEIDAIGTRRRILSLMVMGWTHRDISAESGVTPRTVGRIATGETPAVYVDTARAIGEAFERMCMKRGRGNWKTVASAVAYGGVVPLAWDDIDDPDEQPYTETADRRIEVEDIEEILTYAPATTARQLADRFGCTPDGIQHACRRAGRTDLLAKLARNAGLASRERAEAS